MPLIGHEVIGYYQAESVTVVDKKAELDAELKGLEDQGKTSRYNGDTQPIRVSFKLGKYTKLQKPFTYGLDAYAAKGVAMTRAEFMEKRGEHSPR